MGADAKRKRRRHLIRLTPFLGHPSPGSCKMLSLYTARCDYPVWVTETGVPGLGKTIQPIII